MDLKTKRADLQAMVNQAKSLYAELEAKGDKATADERQNLNNIIDAGEAKRAELNRLEQLESMDKYVNVAGDGASQPVSVKSARAKSWGEMVLDSPEFKSNNGREMQPVEVKAIYAGTDATGGAFVPASQGAFVELARQRPLAVYNLVNKAQTNSDAIEYVEYTTRTNNAAVVPEYTSGDYGLKPESNMVFALKTAPVRTIPTYIRASRQILADAPRLRDMIDGELRYMVLEALETQMISGSGTGNNFAGILNTTGVQVRTMHATTPVGTGQLTTDTMADTLRRAITDVHLAFFNATGIVMNPRDAEEIELSKDSTGNYVQAYDAVAQRIWRVPVVETSAVAANSAIVGDFRRGATLWDRQRIEVRISENVNDDFIRNAVRILAELRAAFAVTAPAAFVKVTMI